MASLIVWLCVHVSKFNTVCVVEHRGGIRAAEHTILKINGVYFQYGVLCSQEAAEHTPYEKGFSMQKKLYNNWYSMPTVWWS